MMKKQAQPLPIIIKNSNKNLTNNNDRTGLSDNQFNDSKDTTRLGGNSHGSSPKNRLLLDLDASRTRVSFATELAQINQKLEPEQKDNREKMRMSFLSNESNGNIKKSLSQPKFLKTATDRFDSKILETQIPEFSKLHLTRQSIPISKKKFKFSQQAAANNLLDFEEDSYEESSPLSPFPISQDRFLQRTLNKDYLHEWTLQQGLKSVKNTRNTFVNISKSSLKSSNGQNFGNFSNNEFFNEKTKHSQSLQHRESQEYFNQMVETSVEIDEQQGDQESEEQKTDRPPSSQLKNGGKGDKPIKSLQGITDRNTQDNDDRQASPSPDEFENTNFQWNQRKKQDKQIENFNQLRMTYKQIQRVQESNTYFKSAGSVEQRYLSMVNIEGVTPQRMNTIPLSELIHQKVNLSGFNVDEQYSRVIGRSLHHHSYSNLENLKAEDANLSNMGFSQILKNLPSSVKELSFQKNKITKNSCNMLSSLLGRRQYENLTYLNLETNSLRDQGAIKIFEILYENSNLKVLNLSNNFITDEVAQKAIGACLKDNRTIEELYLHYNLIRSKGAVAIAEGLKENLSLHVLDLSFNNIGSGQEGDKIKGGKAIIDALTKNKHSPMLHLDLSYNSIGQEEMKDIGQILKQNQRVYGLHLEGNCGGTVDPRGHINFPTSNDLVSQTIRRGNTKPRINGIKKVDAKKFQTRDYQASDVCWLCEGWEEVFFKSQFEGDNLEEPYFIHLSFEGFAPTLLNQVESSQAMRHHEYSVKRMCPPNTKILFFFSSPTQNQTLINNQQKHQTVQSLLRDNRKLLKSPDVRCNFNDGTQLNLNFPSALNVWFTSNLYSPIFSEYLNPLTESKPRYIEPDYIIIPPVKIQWSIPISVFKDWQIETQATLNSCFEADWNNSQIPQIVQFDDDLERLKKILRHHYQVIKNEYKVLAAMGGVGDVPCVASNGFTQFIMGTRTIDNRYLKLADIDFNFVAVNSGAAKDRTPLNPDRVLVRYKFLEIIVRLAIDQYVKSGETKSVSDAVLRLLQQDGVLTRMDEEENQQNWRDNRYWNMECDNVLKEKYQFIKQIYDRFAGSRTDKKAFTSIKRMSVSQFKDLINYYNLYSENFVERDVGVAYNLSMMSQVDEITSERHTQMHMVEFLEALARIAEKSSLVSMINRQFADYTLEERLELPLATKLQGLFYYMANPQLLQQENQANDKQQQQPAGGNTPQGSTPGGRFIRSKIQTATSFISAVNNLMFDRDGQRKKSEKWFEKKSSIIINNEEEDLQQIDQDKEENKKTAQKSQIAPRVQEIEKQSADNNDSDDSSSSGSENQ